jgi:hypothetical protein
MHWTTDRGTEWRRGDWHGGTSPGARSFEISGIPDGTVKVEIDHVVTETIRQFPDHAVTIWHGGHCRGVLQDIRADIAHYRWNDDPRTVDVIADPGA